jgi:hypothetical protein
MQGPSGKPIPSIVLMQGHEATKVGDHFPRALPCSLCAPCVRQSRAIHMGRGPAHPTSVLRPLPSVLGPPLGSGQSERVGACETTPLFERLIMEISAGVLRRKSEKVAGGGIEA